MKDIPWEALVGLLGLLLSLPQLTSAARFRRRMSFWAEQVQSTDIGYDRDIAEGFRRQASAKLLAVEAYPAYKFLVPLYSAFIGLLSAFGFGASLGGVYPKPVSAESLSAQEPGALAFGLTGLGFVFASIVGMAAVVDFRRQVADKYLKAQVIERGQKISLGAKNQVVVEHVREPFKVPWGRALGVVAFSLGLYVLVVNVVFTLRIGFSALDEMTTLGGSILFLSTIGAILLTSFVGPIIWNLFVPGDARWKHPITLSAEAAATRPSVSESQAVMPEEGAVVERVDRPWWQGLLCATQR